MKRDARFYFANLGADVSRCIAAALENNEERYRDSLEMAHRTLEYLRNAGRLEVYEEGLLLLRALEYARRDHTLPAFNKDLDALMEEYSPLA